MAQTALLREYLPDSAYLENPFLQALRRIKYGHLTIVTPANARMEFMGAKPGPIALISINDWEVFEELVARGEMGFAEAYIDGRWQASDLADLLTFGLLNNDVLEQFFHGKPFYAAWLKLKSSLRENTIAGSRRNIMAHYDLGNDFYSLWLDKSMTYSCGLFNADPMRSLEEAQQAKYQRILSKLGAQPGEHILDIGCGWGGFALAAARQGIHVTGITVSERQMEYARNSVEKKGMSDLVSIELRDYRQVEGLYDHIVSIGMLEHVGEKYWPHYFRTVRNHLKPEGKAMIQCITLDDQLFDKLHDYYGFIETYIFPGGMLPSKSRFREAAGKAGLDLREMYGFGQDYVLTLREWHRRFDGHREEILKMGYDERFLRIWNFYLSSCIASFSSNRTDVIQAELTHKIT